MTRSAKSDRDSAIIGGVESLLPLVWRRSLPIGWGAAPWCLRNEATAGRLRFVLRNTKLLEHDRRQ